jgi:hypothetical protein
MVWSSVVASGEISLKWQPRGKGRGGGLGGDKGPLTRTGEHTMTYARAKLGDGDAHDLSTCAWMTDCSPYSTAGGSRNRKRCITYKLKWRPHGPRNNGCLSDTTTTTFAVADAGVSSEGTRIRILVSLPHHAASTEKRHGCSAARAREGM